MGGTLEGRIFGPPWGVRWPVPMALFRVLRIPDGDTGGKLPRRPCRRSRMGSVGRWGGSCRRSEGHARATVARHSRSREAPGRRGRGARAENMAAPPPGAQRVPQARSNCILNSPQPAKCNCPGYSATGCTFCRLTWLPGESFPRCGRPPKTKQVRRLDPREFRCFKCAGHVATAEANRVCRENPEVHGHPIELKEVRLSVLPFLACYQNLSIFPSFRLSFSLASALLRRILSRCSAVSFGISWRGLSRIRL